MPRGGDPEFAGPPGAPGGEATRHAAPGRSAAPAKPPRSTPGIAPRSRAPRQRAAAPSTIHLPHHRVERADARDQVGDVRALPRRGRGLERRNRRRAELHPPRAGATIGDDVAAQLPARRLDGDVDLALGTAVALGYDLEVVDPGLHRGLQLLAWRQYDLAVIRDPRLSFQTLEPVEALVDDLHRRLHLFDPDPVAVVGVPLREHRHVEAKAVVVQVRIIPAKIPIDPRRAQHRPRLTEGDRVAAIQETQADGAVLPDLVLREQRVVVGNRLRHPLDELAALRIEAGRDVLGKPTGLEVPRVHAVAGDELREVEDHLALAERVPEHRDRAELEGGGPQPDQM